MWNVCTLALCERHDDKRYIASLLYINTRISARMWCAYHFLLFHPLPSRSSLAMSHQNHHLLTENPYYLRLRAETSCDPCYRPLFVFISLRSAQKSTKQRHYWLLKVVEYSANGRRMPIVYRIFFCVFIKEEEMKRQRNRNTRNAVDEETSISTRIQNAF